MPAIIREKKPAGFIATGGNIEALAHLAAHPDADGVSRLRVADLQNLIEKMARMSFNDRIRELNLKEDRADVILPAALVYERLALLVGVEEIIVPHVSLLEGVLLDLVGGAVQREGFEEKQTYEGAVSLGKKYLFEEAHALQVARFSLNLFDQLQSLHRLQERERRILLAAAILHDIGTFISFKKHHKHSLYIISQSELPGFSPEEMLMIANIARYHRKSSPADRHDQYTKLAAGDRERVCALSSILRMADALDREHLQKISDVKVEQIRDGEMRLRIRGEGDLLLERWALKNKSRYFSELFDLQVRYEIEEDAS
jgi:exopolyphosphatase/guanosine-5'-triphosphate,3'-diphosphate pyrophosphatase